VFLYHCLEEINCSFVNQNITLETLGTFSDSEIVSLLPWPSEFLPAADRSYTTPGDTIELDAPNGEIAERI
jgi:hypothetical protein